MCFMHCHLLESELWPRWPSHTITRRMLIMLMVVVIMGATLIPLSWSRRHAIPCTCRQTSTSPHDDFSVSSNLRPGWGGRRLCYEMGKWLLAVLKKRDDCGKSWLMTYEMMRDAKIIWCDGMRLKGCDFMRRDQIRWHEIYTAIQWYSDETWWAMMRHNEA